MILVSIGDTANPDGDFKGEKRLARSSVILPVLQSTIDEYEAPYIRKIFGVELGNLLIEYVQGGSGSNPPEARFDAVIDPFQLQPDESCGNQIYESKGLVDALASFIYFWFVRETQQRHGQSGMARSQSDTATVDSPRNAAAKAERIYNKALETVKAIQYKCKTEPETYPEYRGIFIAPEYGSLT
jgi:hypothetical protein